MMIITPVDLTEVSNNVQGIDIFGSWMELGMLLAATAMGAVMAWGFMKNLLNKRNNKDKTPIRSNYINAHNQITESLTELRIKSSADRVSILQFHNGGTLSYGSSLKKWSVTHESTARGITESKSNRQDVLATTTLPLLSRIQHKDHSLVMVSDDIESYFKRLMDMSGTLAYTLYPIYGLRKISVIGCVLVEWCHWDGLEEMDEESTLVEITTTAKDAEALLYQDG